MSAPRLSAGFRPAAIACGALASLTFGHAQQRDDQVSVETIRQVTHALVATDMEGRMTGSPGGERAARYLAGRFAQLGLTPLGTDGFRQDMAFKTPSVAADSTVRVGSATLRPGTDFVVLPAAMPHASDVHGAMVLVGYGEDLGALPIAGRIAVLISGAPRPQEIRQRLFTLGASAVIVANVDTPSRPFAELARALDAVQLFPEDAAPPASTAPVVFISEAAAVRFFATAGLDYIRTVEAAARHEPIARALETPATITIRVSWSRRVGSNIAGVLSGSDPRLRGEAVVYTAHYDALGADASGQVRAGAADNALGTGMLLAIAEALTRAPPRRSVVFLALTGEEFGHLGARHWIGHPTWPIDRVVANLNFDGIGTEVYGPVARIVGFGADYSELGAVLQAAVAAAGRELTDDPLPEAQIFTHSDQYAFARAGIPAMMLMGLPGGELAPSIERAKRWLGTAYHKPGDVIDPGWHWDGARALAAIAVQVGRLVADRDQPPQWLPSSPFQRRK